MMEVSEATTAIWPPSRIGKNAFIIFTGVLKLIFITESKSSSFASQLKEGRKIPAL